MRTTEPLAVTNAVKNMASSHGQRGRAPSPTCFFAPVHWPSVIALSCGAILGSWLGPQIVRVLPERPLRFVIAAAGLGSRRTC